MVSWYTPNAVHTICGTLMHVKCCLVACSPENTFLFMASSQLCQCFTSPGSSDTGAWDSREPRVRKSVPEVKDDAAKKPKITMGFAKKADALSSLSQTEKKGIQMKLGGQVSVTITIDCNINYTYPYAYIQYAAIT